MTRAKRSVVVALCLGGMILMLPQVAAIVETPQLDGSKVYVWTEREMAALNVVMRNLIHERDELRRKLEAKECL